MISLKLLGLNCDEDFVKRIHFGHFLCRADTARTHIQLQLSSPPNHQLYILRRMLKSRNTVEEHIRWHIRRGQLDAKRDKWLLSDVSDTREETQVWQLYIDDTTPNEAYVRAILGEDAPEEIQDKKIVLSNSDDMLAWSLTQSGKFTFASAWDLVRQRTMKCLVAKHTWNKHVCPKIAVFSWKLLHNAVPTDYALKKKHVMLVSKCCCYSSHPQTETTKHLFLESESCLSKLGEDLFFMKH